MPSPADRLPGGSQTEAPTASALAVPTAGGQPTVLVLVGPTAVGKTAAALAIARLLGAEIISADSRYLYRGMDIGTAKPSPAERAEVPHHLIDVTTPDRPWTLSQYQTAAVSAIADIIARGQLPVLVGGTGQYVRAVVEGWQLPPGDPAGQTRAALERLLAEAGPEALAERLRQVDPESAAQVDLMNPRRVIRALEVALTTGASFVALRGKQPPPYAFRWIGLTLPRDVLYARIDARIDAMLAGGLVAEVQRLVARGYTWDLPAMSALGYRQVGAYLRGEVSLPEAIQAIRRATRRFVRRQANWFKLSDPAIQWLQAYGDMAAQIAAKLRQKTDAP